MRSRLLLGVFMLCIQHLCGQIPFRKYERIHCKRFSFIRGKELPDSTPVATAYIGRLHSLNGIRVDIRGTKDNDSCQIILTKNGKPLQQFILAAPVHWMDDSLYVADIDHN